MGREDPLLRVEQCTVASSRVQVDIEEAIVVMMVVNIGRVGQVSVDHLDVLV